MNWFETTVSALAYSILQERCPTEPFGDDHPQNRVGRFVLDQHGRMAAYLRWPLMVLTLGFDAWGCLRAGKPFHLQTHARRWKQVEAWRNSGLGPCRDLIRFYESLVVFGGYSIRRGSTVGSLPTTASSIKQAMPVD